MNWLKKIAAFKQSPAVAFQAVHFLIGQAVVLYSALLGWPVLWVIVGMTMFTAVLEFWYDQSEEKGQTILEDTKDFVFYQAGMWLAYLVVR